MTITEEEKKKLKGRGVILCRDQEHFVARVVTGDGTLTSEQLSALAEAAERFGSGRAALTLRMSVEIQGIPYENIEPLCAFLEQYDLYTGGTGARIRPIVACKGSVCVHGLIDTQALARELHERFYIGWGDVVLPHKFKIGIGGCPNNCIKPGSNDFGIIGQRVPAYDPAQCRRCGRCNVERVCPMKICTKAEDAPMERRAELCTNCGKCIDACPFNSVSEQKRGYRILLGGIWGKRQRAGTPLPGVYSKEEMLAILEKTLRLWKEQGTAGERFGLFLDRVGFSTFAEQLLDGERTL